MTTPTFDELSSVDSADTNSSGLTVLSFTMMGNLLLAFIGYRGANYNVSAVTWNTTESLVLLDLIESGTSEIAGEVWYLKSPTTGSHDLVMSLGGTETSAVMFAVDIVNADVAGTTFGAVANAGGISTSGTVDAVTVADQLVIDFLVKKYTDSTDGALVAGAGQTSRGTDKSTRGTDSDNTYAGISTEIATGVSTTMSWTWTFGSRYRTLQAFGINGASGPAGVKLVQGVAISAVKTVNGVTAATIKTIQSLS